MRNKHNAEHGLLGEYREPYKGSLIRLFTSISRTCLTHAGKSTAGFGLGLSQTILLAELYSHDGCRQDDLRLAMNLDKGTITRAIQGLEEQGFVSRTTDTTDRRAVRVHITDKAKKLEPKMIELALAWDNTLTEGLTENEQAMLTALLIRVESRLRTVNSMTIPRVNLPPE